MLIGFLASCGGSGAEANFSTQALGGGFAPGEVRAVSFDSSNQAQIEFSELSGSEKFSLILFAANPDPNSFNFQLSALNTAAQSKFLARPTSLVPNLENPGEENRGGDPTEQLHESLREAETQFEGQDPYDPGRDSTGTKELSGVRPTCGDGRGISFNVLTSLSDNNAHETVCGIEVRRTSNVVYYVDATVVEDLDLGTLNPLIDDFEAKIPHERALFGTESDVDQNGTFSILFSPAINRLGNSGGGFVTGYFFGGDLFAEASFSGSNEQEVLFLCVPDPGGKWNVNLAKDFWSSNIASSVMPHEYQHMISFNQHVLIRNDGAEEAWANEGISHFIEDLRGDGSLDHVGMENPSRVSLYLNAPEKAPFTSGISIAQRGGTYLFLRYMYEQANLGRYPSAHNGAELLTRLLQSGQKGVSNIEAATGWSFRNLLLDFYAAVQLSDTRISSDPRYNFQGINLYSPQDDNRGTELKGVQTRDLSDLPYGNAIQSAAAIFLEISGKTIMDAGQGLSFSAPPGMISGGVVIRIQ